MALLLLQVQQFSQLNHLSSISCCIAGDYFFDLFNQMDSLPSHFSAFIIRFAFHRSQQMVRVYGASERLWVGYLGLILDVAQLPSGSIF